MDRSTLASLLMTLGIAAAVLTRLAVRWLDLDRAVARPVVVVSLAVLAVGAALYAWQAWTNRQGRSPGSA